LVICITNSRSLCLCASVVNQYAKKNEPQRHRDTEKVTAKGLSSTLDFSPDGPMIGNVQRPRNAPPSDLQSVREDPVGVHSQSRAAPGGGAGRNRRRVAARLQKLPRLETFFSRQRVEVAHDYHRSRDSVRLLRDHFELRQLSTTLGMWIDVRIENTNS